MKRVFLILGVVVFMLTGCSVQTIEKPSEGQEKSIFVTFSEKLTPLKEIEFSIARVAEAAGYSVEHASKIQEVLNAVGIESIQIEEMTGEAESGLNAVVCFPNGYSDRDRRLHFTTENGVIFYVGFSGEDLYDAENGGYLKNYGDVHIPEKEVSLEVYEQLCALAEREVRNVLNYPDSADFSMLDWGIGRSDDQYQVIGKVTAKNGFGVKQESPFSVWFISTESGYNVEGVALDGVRVK